MLDKLAAKIVLSWIVGRVIVGLFILISTGLSHGETTRPRPNSLGVVQEMSNPNTYLFANALDTTYMRDSEERVYSNIRFQPYGTPSMFDESVLFCGGIELPANTPMIFVYKSRASRMYRGIGCHEFVSAFEVK
jgi:hypothetical protein